MSHTCVLPISHVTYITYVMHITHDKHVSHVTHASHVTDVTPITHAPMLPCSHLHCQPHAGDQLVTGGALQVI